MLEEAAQSSPRDVAVQYRLGLAYAMKKQSAKAVARAESAIALSPDDPYVLVNVGEIYERVGDRARALQYVEKRLEKGYPLESLKSDAVFSEFIV